MRKIARRTLLGVAVAGVISAVLRLRRTRRRETIPPVPEGAERVHYGLAHEIQFADLLLPATPGPHPVVLLVHGGSWLAAYDLGLMSGLARSLTAHGFATWNVEYRALGDAGGGWPGTFLDVAAAADHLRKVPRARELDLSRVTTLGHSAGGLFALWLAARPRIVQGELASRGPLPVARAVSLAGISDLRRFAESGSPVVNALLGGDPAPDRYAVTSPIEMLPLGIPQVLIHGTEDRHVPFAMSTAYAEAAHARGDDVTLVRLDGLGHFELIDPTSTAWPHVLAATTGS